ncbi:B-type lectin plumieribetin-like [Gadus macrocephalus]|uniref:B-type lectin plumieribetin-like n=1 Tax=Gadus macrocephalus TaxID=80720 RepID=UPI0028CBB470|nr:B-type lectin plumieribetin-like [Gadus macrocephalus]XP_059927841.1 B-type lectin plumieribetin-like [Gadus macrocephalus]
MNKNSISTNEEILHGEFLKSLNGQYRAVFQIDSNLVIYGTTALWHTDTAQTTGVRLVLQDDGNLVMVTQKKSIVWNTETKNKEVSQRMRLTLTDAGFLEITKDGEKIWTSENSKGTKP